MLKFDQFVSVRGQMAEAKARKSRTDEYNRFVRETLAKFSVGDIHELDDASYEKFVDELKGYRKKGRLVAEAYGVQADLERFRTDCIGEIKRHASRVKQMVSDLVDSPFECYISGSVVDPSRFTAESDVDMAVLMNDGSRPAGVQADLTSRLQRRLLYGFGFGVLDVSVFNKDRPQPGWIQI